MILSVAFALLAASAAPAVPAAQPAPAVAAQPAAKPVKEKKICLADPMTTGSLVPHRICRTKSEWDAITAREKADQRDGKGSSD
jgi:hypothetical protein